MVETVFTLVSGIYEDEQDLLRELDFFLTQTIQGWEQIDVTIDDASDVVYAYKNNGSTSGTTYDTAWYAFRAFSNELRFNAYSFWDSAGSVGSDHFGGDGVADIQAGTSSGTYWFAANQDSVHVVVQHIDTPTNIYHGGVGLFRSYYTPAEDPKPHYVFGQASVGLTFASNRLAAYGPHSWGRSYSTLASGLERTYEASHPTLIAKGTPNPRSGEPKFIEPVFYSDVTWPYYESRGEVPGLYMCGGKDLTHGQLITLTGTLGTVSGTYFVDRYTDDVSWAIGPVVPSGEVF